MNKIQDHCYTCEYAIYEKFIRPKRSTLDVVGCLFHQDNKKICERWRDNENEAMKNAIRIFKDDQIDKIEINEKIEKIASHYGYYKQMRQLIEESSELIQAVCKHIRKFDCCHNSEKIDCEEKQHVIEESADVIIMIMQIIRILGISEKDIHEMMKKKIDRQIKRMRQERKCRY